MTDDILAKFQDWWRQARDDPSLQHKGAVCVSTIDEEGYPNARFVDLKAATADGFTFCTFHDSRKGAEIDRCPKVALTLWWERVGYQVRVQGAATRISRSAAAGYWQSRTRDAQLTTLCSRQSEPLVSSDHLHERLASLRASRAGATLPVPDNWGGYTVRPHSVEFLSFRQDRLHLRERHFQEDGRWRTQLLQP